MWRGNKKIVPVANHMEWHTARSSLGTVFAMTMPNNRHIVLRMTVTLPIFWQRSRTRNHLVTFKGASPRNGAAAPALRGAPARVASKPGWTSKFAGRVQKTVPIETVRPSVRKGSTRRGRRRCSDHTGAHHTKFIAAETLPKRSILGKVCCANFIWDRRFRTSDRGWPSGEMGKVRPISRPPCLWPSRSAILS
jgi:hypothetical protein